MAKTIGGVVTRIDGSPVEFGTIYISDNKGKQTGAVKQTDVKGRFTLLSNNDNEFITAKLVGLLPKTISVKQAVNIPLPSGGVMPMLNIKMEMDKNATLPKVVVTTNDPKKDQPKKDETKKDETKKEETKKEETKKEETKKEMNKNLKIGLMVGGGILVLLILAVIIKQTQK
jgi:hypothetical protein